MIITRSPNPLDTARNRGELTDNQKQVNTDLSGIRAAVERAIAHLKNWKILSGRYRGPPDKLPSVIRTVVALAFFKFYF